MHDSSPLAYYMVLQDLGVEGFRVRKQQISTGAAVVRKLEEEERKQYDQAKDDLAQTYALYMQWLDYMHNTFAQLIQRFHQEKLIPLTNSQPQLSPFSFFVYSAGEIAVNDIGVVEKEPGRKFKAEVESLQQTLYRCCGPANDYQDYFIEAIKAGMQGSMARPQAQVPIYATPTQPVIPVYASAPVQYSAPAPAQRGPAYTLRPKSFATYLPFTRGSVFAKWDTRTEQLSTMKLPRSLNISKNVVSVVLPSGDLCCVGGRKPARLAVVIDGQSGAITDLANMNEGRSNAGIILIGKLLFVFGGFAPSETDLKTAEKYSFDQDTWTPITAQMADARNQFNPVANQQIVYIAGGFHSTKVETFHIVHETFRTVPLELPKAFGTIALIYNNELLVLQDTTVVRWRLGADSFRTQSLNAKVIESNSCPQMYGSRVFFNKESDDQCEIYMIDLTSMEIKMVGGLKNSGPNAQQCPVS